MGQIDTASSLLHGNTLAPVCRRISHGYYLGMASRKRIVPSQISGVYFTNLRPAINDKGKKVWRGTVVDKREEPSANSPGVAAALARQRKPKD
jgi:hypothetical protein